MEGKDETGERKAETGEGSYYDTIGKRGIGILPMIPQTIGKMPMPLDVA